MSGIVGILNLDGAPLEVSLLAKLSAVIAHRGADGEARWMDDSRGFAFQNFWITPESVGELQPFVSASQSVICFDGRLDNREDLLKVLSDNSGICNRSSDAALVAAAYRKYGEAFPEHLIGDFATAVYDIHREKLLLARDGIGVCPLYFAQVGNTFLVASEIKPILAHPSVTPKPNADMVAAYLLACFGQERQGWTFFEDVSSVLPGQLVVVTSSAITKRIYWDFGNPKPIRFKTFVGYSEAFQHYFKKSVARRMRSAYPVAVALSGGLDSSSIFCMGETLRRGNAVPCPQLFGVHSEGNTAESDERFYVEEIERQYDSHIHRVAAREFRLLRGSPQQCFLDMEMPYFRGPLDSEYPFHRTARGLGARTLLTGHWGDQMLASQDYLLDLFSAARWLTVWKHLNQWSYWSAAEVGELRKGFLGDLIRHMVPGSLMPFLREARQRLSGNRSWFTAALWKRARRAEVLQRSPTPAKTAYGASVYKQIRPMYYVQAMEWANKISAVNQLAPAYPFFDRDLVSFLMAIPGEAPCWNGVPKGLLRSAMAGVLPPAIAARRGKAATTKEFNASTDRAFNDLAGALGRDSMAVKLEYLDGSRLESSLIKLRAGIHNDECLTSRQLGDLFGLELWLQSFFGKKYDKKEEVSEYVSATV